MDLGGDEQQINYTDLNQQPVHLFNISGSPLTGDVCQTTGFVKLRESSSGVRFCVQPVTETEHCANVQPSSDPPFTYCEENLSVEDVANSYGTLFISRKCNLIIICR